MRFIDVLRRQQKTVPLPHQQFLQASPAVCREDQPPRASRSRKNLVLTSGEATALLSAGEDIPAQRSFWSARPLWRTNSASTASSLVQEHPDLLVLGFDTTLTYQKLWTLCDHVRGGASLHRHASRLQLPDRDRLDARRRRNDRLRQGRHRPGTRPCRGQAQSPHRRCRGDQDEPAGRIRWR